MPGRRILIFCYGTRGDVEPLLALAVGLKQAGYQPAMVTSIRFRDWIERRGIDVFPLSDELLAIMDTPDGKALMEGGSGPFTRIGAALRLQRKTKSINVEMMHDCWRAARAFEPDLIVFHPKLFAAPHIAEKLDVPAIMAALQPVYVPTGDFPAVGRDFGSSFWNKLTYRAVDAAFRVYLKPVNAFRSGVLGLAKVRGGREGFLPRGAGTIPVLHAISPHVIERPDDWPDHSVLTGYWLLEEEGDYQPPEELAAFLRDGPAPVYAGFGSMTSADPAGLTELLASAFRRAGVRGVVAAGWAGLDGKTSSDLIVIPPVPHRWLFPKMAAVIHHGGAGTTSAGFLAGVPSIICPFIGDQPFWARKSFDIGVGTRPLPRRRLTADRLAGAIETALTDEAMRARAAGLGKALAQEDGVLRAVSIIGSFIERGAN